MASETHRVVTFKFPMSMLGYKEGQYYDLFEKHFGITKSELDSGYQTDRQEILVKCLPEQFAEFLIDRHSRNMSNQFAALSPTIETVPRPKNARAPITLFANGV